MRKLLDVNKDGIVDVKDVMRYEWIVISGLALTIIPMANVLGYTDINSDFFWMLAGICLTVEGLMEVYYEQKHWARVKREEDFRSEEEEELEK